MEYITSRNREDSIPEEASKFEANLRFHLWCKRLWPYKELMPGDILYWYKTQKQSIVWKSRVVDVYRFPYNNKNEVIQKLLTRFHNFDKEDDYLINGPEKGYCLAYKIKAINKEDLPKPTNIHFPQMGWMKINSDIAIKWLNQNEQNNDIILDDLAPIGSLIDRIRQLNVLMKDVSQERVTSIISHTIRKDTQIIRAFKEICEFKCQFPDCNVRIPKHTGGFYIEVAHVKAISKGGSSVIGNLLVLCPNHHKEFDYGKREIIEQTVSLIRGRLNGKHFTIMFPDMNDSAQ